MPSPAAGGIGVPMVLGVVRHLLTLVGGYLVAHGTMDQLQVTQGVGAVCTLIAIGWSVAEKRRASRQAGSPSWWEQPVLVGAGIGLLGLLLLGTGCASPARITTADIRLQFGTNVVTVSQPKDTVIKSLEFDPVTGALILRGYQSTASAAALAAMEAQNASQAQVAMRGMDLIELLALRAAQSQGVPVATPVAREAAAPTSAEAPALPTTAPGSISTEIRSGPGWTVPLVYPNANAATDTTHPTR